VAHIREFTGQGYRIRLDLSEQVVGIDTPEEENGFAEFARRLGPDVEGSSLLPTLPRHCASGFVSAAALALKAKQFDDGLYAATELAAQNGAGRYPGKAFVLTTLVRNLAGTATAKDAGVLAVLCGACQLGGLKVAVPPFAAAEVREAVAAFVGDELRSKPISFYT
jgi:hypothetical protein